VSGAVKRTVPLTFIVENRRGVILNKFIKDGKYSVIGCKEIDRYKVRKIRGLINKDLSNTNAEIRDNSVLVQGIVAHIENPIDHIKIIANVPDKKDYFIADNINQIIVDKNYSNYFVWAIFNSILINWYAYRFIYGKSIRTMRFDNPVTSRLPIPKNTKDNQVVFIELAKKIICLGQELQTVSPNTDKHSDLKNKIGRLETEMNKEIYKLYGLTNEEIKTIEQ
jgi:hypothetical protein